MLLAGLTSNLNLCHPRPLHRTGPTAWALILLSELNVFQMNLGTQKIRGSKISNPYRARIQKEGREVTASESTARNLSKALFRTVHHENVNGKLLSITSVSTVIVPT